MVEAGLATTGTIGHNAGMTPLVLDLDGTLVRSDTLVETALRLLAAHPVRFLALLPPRARRPRRVQARPGAGRPAKPGQPAL